ncbi:hypothetical protein ZHAS_00003496 [Anopheles sinensis]|uniref:Uncharacterized protein n=1 Tax=Anopheles sinensis TaxID=74873 RepID=A0A084VEF9_ANOSI|nr:hypothetical protein ZHAS_00003496 [Anopheles sinensis]
MFAVGHSSIKTYKRQVIRPLQPTYSELRLYISPQPLPTFVSGNGVLEYHHRRHHQGAQKKGAMANERTFRCNLEASSRLVPGANWCGAVAAAGSSGSLLIT